MISRTGGLPTLQQPVAKSSNHTATVAENGTTYLCTGPMILTLPSAAGNGGLWYRIVNAATTTIVTLATFAFRLAPGESITVISDGTNWVQAESRLHVPTTSLWRMPTTPNADDDEFLLGSKELAWTRTLNGTDTPAESYTALPSHLAVQWNGDGGSDELLLTKTVAPGASLRYAGGFRSSPQSGGQFTGFGLFDAAMQEGVIVGIHLGTGPEVALYEFTGGTWNSPSHWFSSLGGTGDVIIGLTRVSNTWFCDMAFGEGGALSIFESLSKTFTVARLQILMGSYNASLPCRQCCDFIRRTA